MQHSYALAIGLGDIMVGQFQVPLIFRDSDPQLERESRIRSGNYFATVAVELENLAEQTNNDSVSAKIEQLVDELLYAQERYEVIKKASPADTNRRSSNPRHGHLR
jgi:hypothetical protein